jgi:uncharacterized damage-inducible protein DinB
VEPSFFAPTKTNLMNIIDLLKTEFEREMIPTRKMLSIIPEDKHTWKPHEKSMDMKTLAVHIAEMPSWFKLAVTTDELDFAKEPYTQPEIQNTGEIVVLFENALNEGRESLEVMTIDKLKETWTLRSGEMIFSTMTKYEMLRHAFDQIIHHRAQLGVYLRLLNVPIPGTYGPSADDQSFG